MPKATPGTGALRVNGPVVRELRGRSSLTIAALAQRVGVSTATLSKVETSRDRRLAPDVVAQLAATLNVKDEAALILPDGEKPADDPDLDRLRQAVLAAGADGRLPIYFTIREAAALLRCSPDWVGAELREGRACASMIAGRTTFNVADLMKIYDDNRKAPANGPRPVTPAARRPDGKKKPTRNVA